MPLAIQLHAATESVLPADPQQIHLSRPPYLMRAEDDWLRAIVARNRNLNVLVHCPELPASAAIAEIRALVARPLWTCPAPGAFTLPEHDGETIVLGDVSMLTLRQQIELYDWLDRFGESSQVISLTSVPLWPLVGRGRFLECLFYRLNVVTLTADPVRH
jgi:transcriptional regulator of aromatic amino acid metabolism